MEIGKQFDHKTLDKVSERLWNVSSSLNGLAGLFTQGSRDFCLDDDEFHGIGAILKGLSEETSILHDIILHDHYRSDNKFK